MLFISVCCFLEWQRHSLDAKEVTPTMAKEDVLVGPGNSDGLTPAPSPTPEPTSTVTPKVVTIKQPTNKKKEKPDYIILDVPLSKKLQKYIYRECKNDKELYLLVMAIIKTESNFDPDAIGIDGHDKGLMQIRDCNLDSLQRKFGKVNLMNPYDNAKCGVYMVRQLYKKYEYMNLTLMAYNCGEAGARRLWKQDIYSTSYSDKVKKQYKKFLKEI